MDGNYLFFYFSFFKSSKFDEQESVLDQPIISESNEIDYQNLEAEKQKFNSAIDSLDSVLIRLEQLWLSNV